MKYWLTSSALAAVPKTFSCFIGGAYEDVLVMPLYFFFLEHLKVKKGPKEDLAMNELNSVTPNQV